VLQTGCHQRLFTADPALQSLPGSTVTITNTTTWGHGNTLGFWGRKYFHSLTIVHPYHATYGTCILESNELQSKRIHNITIEAIPPIVDLYDPASGCALTVFTNLSNTLTPARLGIWKWEGHPMQ
jgi:hypothetical protein